MSTMPQTPLKYATTQETATANVNWVTVTDHDGRSIAAKFIPFDPEVYTGLVPAGYDLVEVYSGNYDEAIFLHSFSEVVPRANVMFGFLRFPA